MKRRLKRKYTKRRSKRKDTKRRRYKRKYTKRRSKRKDTKRRSKRKDTKRKSKRNQWRGYTSAEEVLHARPDRHAARHQIGGAEVKAKSEAEIEAEKQRQEAAAANLLMLPLQLEQLSADYSNGVPLEWGADAAFEAYDHSQKEYLNKINLLAMLLNQGFEVDVHEDVMEIFGRFDKDKDGHINKEEFKDIWNYLKDLNIAFDSMRGGEEAVAFLGLWKWISNRMKADAGDEGAGWITDEQNQAAVAAFNTYKRSEDDRLGKKEVARLIEGMHRLSESSDDKVVKAMADLVTKTNPDGHEEGSGGASVDAGTDRVQAGRQENVGAAETDTREADELQELIGFAADADPRVAEAIHQLLEEQQRQERETARLTELLELPKTATLAEVGEVVLDTQNNLDRAVETGELLLAENAGLRAGTSSPEAIRDSEIATLEASLQEALDEGAHASSELKKAQAQVEWLGSQLSSVDAEEVLSMIEGKDSALQAKEKQISELEGKLADAKTQSKRHSEAEARQVDEARKLRHQVEELTSGKMQLSREKTLAEERRVEAETKLEAAQEGTAAAQSEAASLKRVLASKKGSTDQSVKEARAEVAEMRAQLQKAKDSEGRAHEQKAESQRTLDYTKAQNAELENQVRRLRLGDAFEEDAPPHPKTPGMDYDKLADEAEMGLREEMRKAEVEKKARRERLSERLQKNVGSP